MFCPQRRSDLRNFHHLLALSHHACLPLHLNIGLSSSHFFHNDVSHSPLTLHARCICILWISDARNLGGCLALLMRLSTHIVTPEWLLGPLSAAPGGLSGGSPCWELGLGGDPVIPQLVKFAGHCDTRSLLVGSGITNTALSGSNCAYGA